MTSVLSAFEAIQSFSGFSGQALSLLIEIALRGTILLLVALALALALRRASAAMRHLVWTLALVAMLVLPIVSLTAPVWNVPVFPSSPGGPSLSRTVNSQGLWPAVQQVPAGSSGVATYPAWPEWILLLWAIGSVLYLARVAVGEIRVRRLARRSQLFETCQSKGVLEKVERRLRISRTVEVRTSTEVAIPFTRGSLRPAILLPAEARQWPSSHLELVLAHELAHVGRYDYLTQTLAQGSCTFFWFHPLVWLAAFEMRKERERACDDVVLGLGHQATDYAEFLLELGRGLRHLETTWSTGVAMAHPSRLEVRMRVLLDPKLNHKPLTGRLVLIAAVLAVALALPAASIHATARKVAKNISDTAHVPGRAVNSVGASGAAPKTTPSKAQAARYEQAIRFLQYLNTAELQYRSIYGTFASYNQLKTRGFMKRLPRRTLTLETASGKLLVGGNAPVPKLPTEFKLQIVVPANGQSYSIAIDPTSGDRCAPSLFIDSPTSRIYMGKPLGCNVK